MSTNSKKITRIFVSQGSIEKRETGLNFFGFCSFLKEVLYPKSLVVPIKGSLRWHLFSMSRKIFENLIIPNPLLRTHTCPYQGLRSANISGNFVYVLNRWSLNWSTWFRKNQKGNNRLVIGKWKTITNWKMVLKIFSARY